MASVKVAQHMSARVDAKEPQCLHRPIYTAMITRVNNTYDETYRSTAINRSLCVYGERRERTFTSL